MRSVNARRATAVVTVGLGALLSASPAAANTTLSCRASVASATFSSPLGTAPSVEPLVANRAGSPCATDSENLPQRTFGSDDFGATVTVSHAGAFTYTTASLPAIADEAPGAAALASTQSVEIKTRNEDIVLGQIEAQAGYACTAGAIVPSSSSSIGSVTVNGTPVTIPVGTPYKVNLTSDGDSYVLLNQTTSAGGSLTQEAVVVHIAGPFGTAADFVIAEAKVAGGSGACAGSQGTPPPSVQPCPTGSVYNILDQQCEIEGGSGSGSGSGSSGSGSVPVSSPYQGPTGGSVLSLAAARKLYSSPCFSGKGPNYVLVSLQTGARVDGTAKADRILAFGNHDRVAGLGGADCIDGRGARQTIWDGNGNNRIYGGSGKTRIGDGNGNDSIDGRSGSDWITVGNGRDKIRGGHRSSRIDVGIGFDHIWGGPGHNRIYAPAYRAVVSCGSGRHNVAFVRKGSWTYAHKHGCEKLHMLAA